MLQVLKKLFRRKDESLTLEQKIFRNVLLGRKQKDYFEEL
jgi:hypothetical protein